MSKALDARGRTLGERNPDTVASMHVTGKPYLRLGRHEQAEPLLLKAYESRCQIQGETHPRATQVLGDLVALYEACGKPEEAAKWRSKLPAPK